MTFTLNTGNSMKKLVKPIEYNCAVSKEGMDEAIKLINTSNVKLADSDSNEEDAIKSLLQLISDYMFIMLTKGKEEENSDAMADYEDAQEDNKNEGLEDDELEILPMTMAQEEEDLNGSLQLSKEVQKDMNTSFDDALMYDSFFAENKEVGIDTWNVSVILKDEDVIRSVYDFDEKPKASSLVSPNKKGFSKQEVATGNLLNIDMNCPWKICKMLKQMFIGV